MKVSTIVLIIISFLIISIAILIFLFVKEKKSHLDTINRNKDEIDRISNEHKSEIDTIRNQCQLEIDNIRQKCANEIRHEKEAIESHKEKLLSMSEKELLMNVMFSLEGYSGRIERLESALSNDRISQQIDDIATSTTTRLDEMAQSVMKQLNNIDIASEISSSTEDIKSMIEEVKASVCDKYGYDTVLGSISSLSTEVSYIKSDIESLRSSVDDARYAADWAKSAAEDAKSAIDSHF